MCAHEIREKFGKEASEAGQNEQSSCPAGTSTLLKVLVEIAAQLAEQNAYLSQIAEKLETAHI